MAKNKTQVTEGSGVEVEVAEQAKLEAYLDARASPAQRADCEVLMALLQRITNESPRMWGPSIVGYGVYRYRYDSGHSGESCLTGFAIRGKELVVYLVTEGADQPALLAKLGPYKMGKACLYLKRLEVIDMAILEQLLRASAAQTRRRYP